MQILVLQNVARRLGNRDSSPDKADALAKGSIFAAAAKLMRALCKILAGWRRSVAEREAKGVAEESGGQFAGVEEFLQGEWGRGRGSRRRV